MAKDYKDQVSNNAVAAVRERQKRGKQEITLSTGYRAILTPVSGSLLDDAASRVPDAKVPVWHDPDRNRDFPNPDDPAYKAEVELVDKKRGLEVFDVVLLLGLKLLDPIPPDEEWMPELQYLEKKGKLDLSQYDLSDPVEHAFVFKKYKAVSSEDMPLILGLNEEARVKIEASFQGDGSENANTFS